MCSMPDLFSCCLSVILALRALSTENAAHPRTMPCTAFVSFHLTNCNCSSFYLSIAPMLQIHARLSSGKLKVCCDMYCTQIKRSLLELISSLLAAFNVCQQCRNNRVSYSLVFSNIEGSHVSCRMGSIFQVFLIFYCA